jgi:hypothetical protein
MTRTVRGLTALLAVAWTATIVNGAAEPPAPPPAAEIVLAEARAQATAGHKAIFVHFSASWCSWCRRLESFLDDESIEPILSRHFIFVRLVVREREPNKHLDHPGGMDVLARFGGEDRGIPFIAMLAADGTLRQNSMMRVEDPKAVGGMENIGYPGEPESIAHFLGMLQTAAPGLTAPDRQTLEAWLVAHQPK